jgi:hypothetical protein
MGMGYDISTNLKGKAGGRGGIQNGGGGEEK